MHTSAVWTRTSKASLLAFAVPTALGQETATSAHPLEEIIVTAQKWEQSANTVGMSITAATDEVLRERGMPDHDRAPPYLTRRAANCAVSWRTPGHSLGLFR